MCERKAKKVRRPPWSLVRHACLELHRLMPAGRPCQAGAGLLGLFASTFFRPFFVVLPDYQEYRAKQKFVSFFLSYV